MHSYKRLGREPKDFERISARPTFSRDVDGDRVGQVSDRWRVGRLLDPVDKGSPLSRADVLAVQRLAGNRVLVNLLDRAGHLAVQRTKVKLTKDPYDDEASWEIVEDTKSEPDNLPHPANSRYKFSVGDVYDRRTGYIEKDGKKTHILDTINKKTLKRLLKKSWYPEKRSSTAYGQIRGHNLQGPHTIAHIFKRTAAAVGRYLNRKQTTENINTNSAILPTPGKARKFLNLYMRGTGKRLSKERLEAYLSSYKGALDKASKGGSKEVAAAMEMAPGATYRFYRKASKKQIGGKGERADKALDDLKVLFKIRTEYRETKQWKTPSELSSFDPYSSEDMTEDDESAQAIAYVYDKSLRDLTNIASGTIEEISDIEGFSSDDEFVFPEIPTKKNQKRKRNEPDPAKDVGPEEEESEEPKNEESEEEESKKRKKQKVS